MTLTKEIKTKETKKTNEKYSKKSFLKSKKYAHRRDILETIIKDDEQLTTMELEKRIDTFMKGEVK